MTTAPSTRVIAAIANEENVSPADLDPLAETVDPEAIDALFGGDAVRELTFCYAGYEVTMDGDGRVAIGLTAE